MFLEQGDCRDPSWWDSGIEGFPHLFDPIRSCELAKQDYFYPYDPPSESCDVSCIDEDCDAAYNEGCSERCGNLIDDDCDGYIDEGCAEICGDEVDNNGDGRIDEGCAENCGDGLDNNSNGTVDEGCEMPDAPPADTSFDPSTADDPLSEVNAGCQNGDWAGYDPIHLATRSAATEPFTDVEVGVLRSLSVTRSYSSGDVMSGGAAGIFGLGWHHNWEATLTCRSNAASCTVKSGLGDSMEFAAQASAVVGSGALEGESLVLYRRTEPENLAAGGHNLMIRRPSGEFIMFQMDGSELHFVEPASCQSYCMDANYNGALRLTRDVDATGRAVQLDFTVAGKLLALTDDLGNVLSLSPSAACPSLAGSLSYQPGAGAMDSTYVTYEYDATCSTLLKVVPANYVAAPGKTAQLRRYVYRSTPRPGLLDAVRNEFDEPVVIFQYYSDGNPGLLVDAHSQLTITYPQPNQDIVVSAYGKQLEATTTHYRDTSGKASKVTEASGLSSFADEWWMTFPSENHMEWNGRYLVCSDDDTGRYLRYFARDEHNRVTMVADYGNSRFAGQGDVLCRKAPWNTMSPLRFSKFEYGVTKTIAEGVTLSLDLVTKKWSTSVFSALLAPAGDDVNSQFNASETLDYDPASKPGDPTGYSCAPSSLSVGAVVCRRIIEGYTYDASGQPTLQRLGTFYTYDARGRLVRVLGPVYLVGTAPPGNIDPLEERTYWPDDDVNVLRRGRLHEVKRWPQGQDGATALVTTYELYDAFGPTQVIDEAGGTTVYSRAGGAGRVTRVDTPDGRHVTTRYYDGNQPRLLLLNGGSARRFSFGGRGRLLHVEPLAGDPENPDEGPIKAGWKETRDYDLAGNMTQITRTDANGLLRWKQDFEHYPNGELRRMPHPEAGKGYARWTRHPSGVLGYYWDEDLHVTHTLTDGLKRTALVSFEYWDAAASRLQTLPGGYSYEYEPWQGSLGKISLKAYAPTGTYPVIATYVHDDFGRLLSVSAPGAMTVAPYLYSYDARGNVVKRTGGASEIRYQYDGVNRLTLVTAKRIADSSSFSYTYSYDDPSARGRLHSIAEPDRTTTFTYDEVGRVRFEEVTENGIQTTLTTEYLYDADGDLSAVITPSGLHVKYERDPTTKDITEVRNVTTGTKYASGVMHLPAGGPITDLTFAGGAALTQAFNLRYEPVAISSGPLALSYTVTGSGLMSAIGPQSFGYDKRDRLEWARPLYSQPYRYVYPEGSAATQYAPVERPIEAQDETGIRRYAFGYDDGSNLSAISPYDGTGTSLTGTTCLVHDALGRLTAVGPAKVLADPSRTVCKSENDLASVSVRFRYDARNRRVARQDGDAAWKYWVFTPDGTPLAELTMPATSGSAWSVQREYVWLEGRPVAQVEYPGPTGGDEGYVYLFHVDHLGQPRALTSMAGVTVWSASPPRPYGDLVEATAMDPANGRYVVTNLRLPGQYDERLLNSVGLQGPYYNGARWYLPSMARYMELDPAALRGGLNGGYAPDWYGYANGNPLRWTDPKGEEAIGAIVGAIFGGVQGALSARTTGGNWVAGMFIGAGIGLGMGLLDPSLGIGVMITIGGGASFLGSVGGQLWGGGPGNFGSLSTIDWWAVGGATTGGVLAGAFAGTYNQFAGPAARQLAGAATPWLTQLGEEVLKNGIGALTGYISELEGTALGHGGRLPEPTQTGRLLTLAEGLGCK